MDLVIGIGEYVVSNKKEDVIKTYALASCVAVTMYCPSKKASGMIHIALPESQGGKNNPLKQGYYATIGVPFLYQTMIHTFGSKKEELYIRLYGGANSIRDDDIFLIGQKNIEAIKLILTNIGLNYYLQEVGGSVSRSIEMEVTTGDIKFDTQPIRI